MLKFYRNQGVRGEFTFCTHKCHARKFRRPRTALGKLIALPDSSAGVRARCPMSAILIGLGDYSSHCLRHNLLVKYNSGLMKFQHFPTLCSPLLSVCIQIQAETTEFPSYTRKIIPG